MTDYSEAPEAQTKLQAIVDKLPAPRRKVLTVRVFERAGESPIKPREEARRFVSSLGLLTFDIDSFDAVARSLAYEICENVASHELVHLGPLLSQQDARSLVARWFELFGEDAVFLTNGEVGRLPNLGRGKALVLVGSDLEAGVIAVSGDRVGLFWNSENA